MKKAWKSIDLEGGGLQSVNQRLSAALRRRPLAYLLWLAFPLGAHRWYLHSMAGALAYLVLSAAAVLLWLADTGRWAGLPLLVSIVFALYDLFWIDRRVVALNKALRMRIYLGAGAEAPAGYRGRYTDQDLIGDYVEEKERERAGVQPVEKHPARPAERSRMPSFAEQEAMLRELARHKKPRRDRHQDKRDAADADSEDTD